MSYDPCEHLGPMEPSYLRRAQDAIEENSIVFALHKLAPFFFQRDDDAKAFQDCVLDFVTEDLDARLPANFGKGLEEVWEEIWSELRFMTPQEALAILTKAVR